MRLLLEYKNFLNSKFYSKYLISESTENSFAGIIGDSQVGLYTSQIKDLRTFGSGQQVLNLGGWSSTKLRKALENHTSVYPEIGIVFIKIGDNDGFRINLAKENAPVIKEQIKRIFPNVTRMVMIKGGWGWGGLSRFQSQTEPKEFVEYYEEFQNNGFEVTNLSQGLLSSDAMAHSVHEGIKAQCDEIRKIIDGFQPSDALVTSQVTEIGQVGDYYQKLDEVIQKGEILQKQKFGEMTYSVVVEAAQLGLKFLGFDLPKYGADGYFGPETERSVKRFKQVNGVGGDPSLMDTEFFVSLKSKLQEKGFDDTQVKRINFNFAKDFGKTLTSYDGNNMWIYWLAHNQGAYGASELLRVALDPNPAVKFKNNARNYFMADWFGKTNHIRRNVGDKGQDGIFKSQIKEAYDNGDDKGVALAFTSYQKWKFDQMYKNGNQAIHSYPEIKEIFLKALKEKNSSIPFEFLAAVSYQESKFNPLSGNNKYMGLFALEPGESTGLTTTTVKDPYKNTLAAIDFWNRNIPALQNNLTADVKNALKIQPLA
jgi:hypothetical protein